MALSCSVLHFGSTHAFVLVDGVVHLIYLGEVIFHPAVHTLRPYIPDLRFAFSKDVEEAFPAGAPPQYDAFRNAMKERGFWIAYYNNAEKLACLGGQVTMRELKTMHPSFVNIEDLEERRDVSADTLEFAARNIVSCVRAFHASGLVIDTLGPSLFYAAMFPRTGEMQLRVICDFEELGLKRNYAKTNFFSAPEQLARKKNIDGCRANLYSTAMIFLFWYYRLDEPSDELKKEKRKLAPLLKPMTLQRCTEYMKSCVTHYANGYLDTKEWNIAHNAYVKECVAAMKLISIES